MHVRTKEEREQYWKLLVSLLKDEAVKQGKKPYHIAKFVNLSPSTITRVFDLQFCPKFNIIIAIMESLNVSFSDLDKMINKK